jgi:glyoxylate reductase
MPRIFVSRRIPDAGLKILKDTFGEGSVDVYPSDDMIPRKDLLSKVRGVDAIFLILTETMDAEVFDAAGDQLKIVANMAVGFNNIDVAEATKRGIPISNTPGVLTETTADLTFALLLAAARRIPESEVFLRDGQWKGWGPLQFLGTDVHGKTLGIFGMGRIGQAVALRAKGFGMPILYTNRNRLDSALETELNATYVDKATLLKESDFISIHCPFNDETKHAFKTEDFAAMKDSAYLVNTSRGPVVDEAALVQALNNKTIRGAALDVFEEEPKLTRGLDQCPNAVIIPHLGSATLETRGKMASIAAENIVARLNGETPPNCVNPEVL